MRVARNDDPTLVKELHASIFPYDDLPRWTAQTSSWIVYSDEGEPIGFALARLVDGGKTCFLERAGLFESHTGGGIQRRLVRARERWARECGCTHAITYVAYHNWPSLMNLLRCGYKFYRPARLWAGAGFHYFIKEL